MMDELTSILVCPACHGALDWRDSLRVGLRIVQGKAVCSQCRADYPLREGIGVFFPSHPKPDDLWEQVDRETIEFLHGEPVRAHRLMDAPLESLGPTDLLVRGFVHESRQEFGAAKIANDLAVEGLYTPEFRAASKSQMRFLKERLADRPGPIVDLASGRGSLLEFLLSGASQEFVGTDLSTRVLLRDQRFFDFLGLGSKLSLLALDARHTPFADHSVPTLVTNVGLANIENPGPLLRELRRAVSGEFLAITIFYPETEGSNADMIRRLKLEPLLYRRSAVREFEQAGFSVQVSNSILARARPTPPGVIMHEIRPDRLPVVEAELECCTLVAT
jgi:uncharacterized protein YbaR (Trm112 family)